MTVEPPSPHAIWREFHWAFFLNVQGLIMGMRRFSDFLDRGSLAEAEEELRAATVLMHASAAAMQLAGSFTRDVYNNQIRVSMTPPTVQSDDFSGLMSWEHGVLVTIWRDLRPRFADLPAALAPAHVEFVRAYQELAIGHTRVCAKFVDADGGSLRFSDRKALETLRRFGESRMDLIDPQRSAKGCPFS